MENILNQLINYLPLFGVFALGFVIWKNAWVSKQDEGDEKMKRIAKNIADGAMSFLKAEYRVLSIFVFVVAVLLYFKGESDMKDGLHISNGMVALSFVVGAICSALAGFIGMKVATKANVRTTEAAKTSLGKALEVAFSGGSVMGLGVVGLGVLGLSSLLFWYQGMFETTEIVLNVLAGFSLGASSIALFARVGGGDLFESYVGSIIATMVLGATLTGITFHDGMGAVYLPLVLAAAGIIMSITGTFFVRVKDGGSPHRALNIGEFGSAALMIGASWFIINAMLPETFMDGNTEYTAAGVFYATIAGLVAGLLVGKATEMYTGTGTKQAAT